MSRGTIAIGSDERTGLTEAVTLRVEEQGWNIELFGALTEDDPSWPVVGRKVAERVATGGAEQGILFCWTGTGVSMAANKVPGARAALCSDAETARGARKWNDANILCISLRAASPAVAEEILNAWLSTQPEDSERHNIELLNSTDRVRSPTPPKLKARTP